MKVYPICLTALEERRAIVVGGGEVALRKVHGLLEAGACVMAISPVLCQGLEVLVQGGRVEAIRRTYRPGDLSGAHLVIAATDDALVNQTVAAEAGQLGCLVNVVDDPAHSNFIVPAVVRRGEVLIAISTGGASPALARRLRERLEEAIGPEYGDLARLLAEVRPRLLAAFDTPPRRQAAAAGLLDSDLLSVLERDGYQAALRRALQWLEAESGSAKD